MNPLLRWVAGAALIAPLTLAAQLAPNGFDLNIANIMRGPEHFGREPQNVSWSADGQWVYFQWNPPGTVWDEVMRPYRVRAVAGGVPERLTDAQMDSVAPFIADGPRTRDGLKKAVSARGDLYLIDTKKTTLRRLTETVSAESDPRFSADERALLFTRDGNAFALELATGLVRQLTDVRPGPAPRDSARATGMRGALERQQRELLEVIRDRQRADSLQRAERAAAAARGLQPAYLPVGERLAQLSVSPNLRTAIVLTASNPPGQPRLAQVPNYVTSSGFTEEIGSRTKVGDGNVRFRAYRLELASGKLSMLHVIGGDSARAAAQVRFMGWNDEGSSGLLSAGTPDFKWRYLITVGDAGPVQVVDALRDTAWVGGPCGGCMGWLPDGRVWFASEASGFAQLYSVNRDGTGRTALTDGAWEVTQAELSADRKWFWLHTSEESPFVTHFYRLPVAGGKREKITRDHGGHRVVVSPDGKRLADVFSQANVPPELFVADAADASRVQLTTSTSEAFRKGSWIKPAIVKIRASDGVDVPSRIYRPQDVGAQPNGAAVIFVHGAGYMHNVHDYWSSYSREYMFNHYLASKGYVVLDMDYRASAGYGRDWRTAIYRWMGGRDLADEVDGSRWLQKEYGINPERIGLYGGSYGGFMTLMALFNAPKDFGAGAALRSVTDWSHYNHGYTGGILNLPQDDTLAYRRSSPIYFAEGLEDPLLMAHGMVDTNVHFQDIVRLTQRFIELGKTGWDLAVYPVEDHGFVRPTSWTDEYTRIFDLFERTIGPNGTKAKK
ncbi:MAG: S9 family peptidase [Gemmatimonadaceae bacterium]|nr:S9 family peptidase [Gemmatimonadaceae bacterium]